MTRDGRFQEKCAAEWGAREEFELDEDEYADRSTRTGEGKDTDTRPVFSSGEP